MVWGLIPVDSLSGALSYYIFAKGTYRVGRKDCDVIIQTDRAISRLHAEIIVGAMTPDLSSSKDSNSKILIRDHSKFGTYVNKEQSNKAVHSYPRKERDLKDGDVISFGTGNASFRFCFINVAVFVGCSVNFQADYSLQTIVSSVGAVATYKWSSECTYVLAEESSAITSDIVDAIAVHKPVILGDWFKILAEKSIRNEIPDCSPYVPNMMLDGACVKIVDPKAREKCLEGYTFIVGSVHLYKFGDKLLTLLRVAGADVIQIDDFYSNSQRTAGGGRNQIAFVNPIKSVAKFSQFDQLNSLSRVSELELMIAAFSGHLEPSKLEPPSIIVTSSHSTDETIVADSQIEVDTATSDYVTNIKTDDTIKHENMENVMKDEDSDISKRFSSQSLRLRETGFTQRKYEDDEPGVPESQNSDIIYSCALIVKDTAAADAVKVASHDNVVNFKRFRKNTAESGNSFGNFIPFSKDPYRESDLGNNDVMTCMKEEKRRKQMEAVAEDLFNSEKAKKRGSSGASLLKFFSRA